MIRFVTLLVLAAFLLVSLIDYVMGNSSRWYSDLGTAFLVAGVVFLLLSRPKKTTVIYLPGGEGSLTIDGEEEYSFLYAMGTIKGGKVYQGETESVGYKISFTAHHAQEGKIEVDRQVLDDLEKEATVHGTVVFGPHRIPIKLRKMPARCGCESEIPCWRGERYTGVYYRRPDMLVQIDCIVIRWRRKVRVPAKKKKMEKRFPSLLPNPVPTPSV